MSAYLSEDNSGGLRWFVWLAWRSDARLVSAFLYLDEALEDAARCAEEVKADGGEISICEGSAQVTTA